MPVQDVASAGMSNAGDEPVPFEIFTAPGVSQLMVKAKSSAFAVIDRAESRSNANV